jgi:hypothetical protein
MLKGVAKATPFLLDIIRNIKLSKLFGQPMKAIRNYELNRRRLKHLSVHLERFKDIDVMGKWGGGSYDLEAAGLNLYNALPICRKFVLFNLKYTILLNHTTKNIEIHKSQKTIKSSKNEYYGQITEISAMKIHPVELLAIGVWVLLRRTLHYALIGLFTGIAVATCLAFNFPRCLFD